MGFRENKYKVTQPIKLTKFLLQQGYTTAQAQRMIDRGRIRQNNEILCKTSILSIGEISIIEFASRDLGIPILFLHYVNSQNTHSLPNKNLLHTALQHINFCIIHKPAKLLTHPKKLNHELSILDQLRFSFGKNANPCHRLDYETSGILLCGLDKQSERELKSYFTKQEVQKEYFAIVYGAIKKPLYIESDIVFAKDFGNLCIKGHAENIHVHSIESNQERDTKRFRNQDSTKASTLLFPMQYFQNKQELSSFFQSLYAKNIFAPPFMQTRDIHSYITHNFLQDNNITESSSLCGGFVGFDKALFLQFLNLSFAYAQSNLLHSFLFIHSLQSYSFLLHYYLQQMFIAYKSFIMQLHNADSHTQQDFSLIKLIPITGKTHQLRIHTSSINHAILGDTLYGLDESVASFFLDSQNIYVVLQNVLLFHISIQRKISFFESRKKFVSLVLSRTLSPCFAQIHHNMVDSSLQYMPSLQHTLPIYHQNNTSNTKEQDTFFTFLFFFFSLPFYQNEILNDMRIYYCKSERLLLHAFSLELFGMRFQSH